MEYRITQLRAYLFIILDEMLKNSKYKINANMLDNDVNNYSLDKINERISKSMYKYYKPMSQKSIYQQYLLKSKTKHKGIYGLYLYYY